MVDDALTVRELQRSILERADFEVRVASDGIEALSLLAVELSDLVITDIEMPNMDGFALTRSIRADARLANMPVLILSSGSSDERSSARPARRRRRLHRQERVRRGKPADRRQPPPRGVDREARR